MCKYCEVEESEAAFKRGKTNRGELITCDCDIEMWIEKEGNEYFLNSECWCGYYSESFEPINFCPFCGRELI
ncbi:hypothetical protein KLM92_18820 [Clostridioides difficile]|nr:hypothetical protein [Clostridioides difficile]MCP3314325.1 hypothetical protein [Clostridioides difficile]MCZ8465265.1 hypothetical protein [Clostridioides difficile]MDI7814437.1 hypothetical protein [Clostridioides difficile]MDO0070729.1 hypothetical protein [Clostridioides difficile]